MATDVQKDEQEAIRKRIAQWERSSTRINAMRAEEIRNTSTPDAMRVFKGSALWAAKHRPAKLSSGLVEQQRWFRKLGK